MQKARIFWLRMIPAIIITIATILLSLQIYNRILTVEKDDAWKRLELATNSTAGKIEVRLRDNLSFLEAVSDAYILTQGVERADDISVYLSSVHDMTIFESISVVYSDETMVLQDGTVIENPLEMSYAEMEQFGIKVSPRMTDVLTGREVLYCFCPIETQEGVIGILIGTLDCISMSSLFAVATYGEDAQLFLIDCYDGNYIIDNWHDNLGNVYDLGVRKDTDGNDVDLISPTMAGQTFRAVYISRTNGEVTFQYAVPVGNFNWELCIAVQEDVVYAHVNELDNMLLNVGTVEFILLMAYLIWNYLVTYRSVLNEEKAQKLEIEKVANEAKSRFISNMSHDIRTPMNAIIGFTNLGLKGKSVEEKDGFFKKISTSADHLLLLINEVLEMSHIESGKITLDETVNNLDELFEEMQLVFSKRAEEKSQSLTMQTYIQNEYVYCDKLRINQILINLIGNSIKYTREGGSIMAMLDQHKCNEEGYAVYELTVVDNGIGMSKEFAARVFEPFEREHNSTISKIEGTGLGLSIVKHVVEVMGGTITMDTEQGYGTVFTVILKLRLADSTLAKQKEVEKSVVIDDVQQMKTFFDGKKVLLVEDNEFNREIGESILEDVGFQVYMAENGQIALDKVTEAPEDYFDLILMDIQMPVMNGYEAARAIRSLGGRRSEVQIIAVTANAFDSDRQKAIAAGMNAYVSKPIDVRNLYQVLSELVLCKK